jgi:hypothetical protein
MSSEFGAISSKFIATSWGEIFPVRLNQMKTFLKESLDIKLRTPNSELKTHTTGECGR